ncbi:hypothetical protein HYALB_00011571 [Hymenoscyphus albidus]|uniref:U1-type domain-containing protein n=1 Tax=Hymenoscyphus albidus TaxID=595503 RepID=A0A9N9PSX5_9HELO|nr:hypothetical protein HYALB_00011571 [Hymenoscyphus albidus]
MSEYWKSTPKYWCKHCKSFIRDTKLEKANHEATPKHQGNLKRFLRDLHRGHEKDEKDKDRAKSEVARLNGLVSNPSSSSSSSKDGSSSAFGRGPTPSVPQPRVQATAAQRKQQLAQLAEMGVSIPDEFRGDMAMAGEWTVTSQRVLDENGEAKKESVALGVRKREEDDEGGDTDDVEIKRKRWGSKFRSHPVEEDEGDLDALLGQALVQPKSKAEPESADLPVKIDMKTEKTKVKVESPPSAWNEVQEESVPKPEEEVKKEFPDSLADIPAVGSEEIPKKESEEVPTGVVFKKRKAKNIRQK